MTAMLLGLMVVAVSQSLMRNLKIGSGQTLSNMLLLIKYLTFFLGIVGASLATHHNRHINVDVLSLKLGRTGKLVLRVILGVAVITLACFLAISVHEFIASQQLAMVLERHPSRKVLWSITELQILWAVFVIFCLLVAHLVMRWVVDIGALVLSGESGKQDKRPDDSKEG